jgi:hypothetical protein
MITALTAGALCGALTASATAAPTSLKEPRITGRAVYLSTLTCHRGTWSKDAVSFTYKWEANGATVGTTPKLEIPLAAIGSNIICIVTARDAHGGRTPATAGGVNPVPATPRLTVASARASGHTVTVSGLVSPRQAVSRTGALTLERRDALGLTHVTPAPVRPRPDGHFTVRVNDATAQGRETYILIYQPNREGFVAQVQARRTLTVH